VSREGAVVDTGSRAICAAPDFQDDPAIAPSQSNYLVVWEDDNSGAGEIYGSRVAPDGTVLDTPGFLISSAWACRYASVCSDGVDFLVVWQDRRILSDMNIFAARVTSAGAVLDTAGIPVCTAAGDQGNPRIAFDGSNFVVVWGDGRGASSDIRAARVTREGVVLDTSGILVCGAACDQSAPAIACSGGASLVAWSDYRSTTNNDIYAARLNSQGVVLDSAGIVISAANGDQTAPSVAFDGTSYLVTWRDLRDSLLAVYAARVTVSGAVLDPDGIAVSTNGKSLGAPAAAASDLGFMVVWPDGRTGYDVFGSRVSEQGVVLDPQGIALSIAVNEQVDPAVGTGDDVFLTIWTGWQGGTDYDILGARVSASGQVLDSTDRSITWAPGGQGSASIARGDSGFLVAWQDPRHDYEGDIYAARVSELGAVLDTAGIPVCTTYNTQWSPTVSSDGAGFLVAWADIGMRPGSILGTRVTAEGHVVDDSGITISANNYFKRVTSCFGAGNYFVVWSDYHGTVGAARVTPQGTVLSRMVVSGPPGGKDSPSECFDGANYLVVWEDLRGGSADIYAARVTPNGVLLDSAGIPVCVAAGDQLNPAVCFDGVSSLVVWADGSNGSDHDIYGARVAPDGTVFDSGPVVRQAGDQLLPALARLPGSRMLLLYQGWTGTVGNRVYNCRRIWGKLDPHPGVEEAENGEVRRVKGGATIVRGVLRLPVSPFTIHSSLFDMTGCQVMALHPGPNDVSGLAPGVYFVRSAVGGQRSAVRKVVIQR
jgi:hypothetical protein